jgi:hypothetical protein
MRDKILTQIDADAISTVGGRQASRYMLSGEEFNAAEALARARKGAR